MQNKKGFTLIELVIVMAVVAILMAIIIPAFQGMQTEGEISEAEAEINTLKTAVISYKRHNGNFPVDIAATLVGATPKIIGAILEDPFKTDTSTNPDTYGYTSSNEAGGTIDATFGHYFIIYSKGPDMTAGTTWSTTNDRIEKDATNGVDDIVVGNAPIIQL